MTNRPAGGAGAAFYLTARELSQRGLTPAALTPEQALTLVREAFALQGERPPCLLEIAAYPEAGGVLLLAHTPPPVPRREGRPFPPLRRSPV